MIRLLFVDDEQRLLSGLRRQLHGRRGEWEMRFAGGGEAALEMLGAATADVVVSDMRMPGMDGAQLLERVAREHPRCGRIVLSGQADAERTGPGAGHAHRFLDKPCPYELLESEIRANLAARALVDALEWDFARRLWSGATAVPPDGGRAPRDLRALLALAAPEGAAPGEPKPFPGECELAAMLAALRLRESLLEASPSGWERAERAARSAQALGLEPLPVLHAALACLLEIPAPARAAAPEQVRAVLGYLLPTWGLPQPLVGALAAPDSFRDPATPASTENLPWPSPTPS